MKPLEGIRVLDVTLGIAGPYCAQLLADAGAEVIKIEKPGEGDVGRRAGNMFLRFNHNKKSLSLDLKTVAGKEVLLDLVKVSDVFVENFRPGVMEDVLGISYDLVNAINPRIIYVAPSGFGRLETYRGPWWDRPAVDIVAQAMGGLLDISGSADGPPVFTTVAFGDLIPGIFSAYGVMLALWKREQTGKGDFIDIAMLDTIVTMIERVLVTYSLTGKVVTRGKEDAYAPWGPYKTADGYIATLVYSDESWGHFCRIIGREDLLQDKRLANGPGRFWNRELWEPIFEEWLSDKTKEEATQIFLKAGFPTGPVYNVKEVFESEQVKARGMLVDVDHPELGKIKLVNTPVKLASATREEYLNVTYPPLLGEHTDQILRDILGYTSEQIQELKAKKAI